MFFSEVLPDDIFSHHVESYWHINNINDKIDDSLELLLPTGTFNIIFFDQACFIKTKHNNNWKKQSPGTVFLGQRSTLINIKSDSELNLWGVRFKPFAFANIINAPLFLLNDEVHPMNSIFSINRQTQQLLDQITSTNSILYKKQLLDELMAILFKRSFSIDEKLRAQLNFIMDRRGNAKILELLSEFKISKVTLRNHFVTKMGLTPKKISQIWRMNHFFKLKEENPNRNLTYLSIEAGYYDQAHFIKDFKMWFGEAPKRFFKEKNFLIKVAHQNISKRFTNMYDPRYNYPVK